MIHERLEETRRARPLVRVERDTVEPGAAATGYVVAVGPEFFLLQLVADDINFDGFQAMRIAHLTTLEAPHDHVEFIERALEARGSNAPPIPAVDVTSLRSLLVSAGQAFRLVTIHRELIEPDACHIGAIEFANDEAVRLREIGPDAEWDEEIEEYALDDITRVDFGGRYEEALLLVAGAG